jgi:ArsR family transcriptional regulator, arsenate/arsenite/antimonite-responsive transcriptional repressor
MGLTKSEMFSQEQNELATIAKVLAHPARIAILQELMKMNVCVCGELVTEIGLAQATISQHLKELTNIELIQGTIEGTSICYCINREKWKVVQRQFSDFFQKNPLRTLPCCD